MYMSISRQVFLGANLIMALSLFSTSVFAKENVVGQVKVVVGEVKVLSDGELRVVKPGSELRQSDTIITSSNGRIGITFRDDSRSSLGPNTEMQVKQFRFSPARNEYSFITKIAKGTMMYVSGLISKLSPKSARVETPTATIGIRGTRFLLRVEEE